MAPWYDPAELSAASVDADKQASADPSLCDDTLFSVFLAIVDEFVNRSVEHQLRGCQRDAVPGDISFVHGAVELDVHLSDYKVRILDSHHGTQAIVRVIIDTENGKKRWSTVGASTNIIEASWRALSDSMEYALLNGSEPE